MTGIISLSDSNPAKPSKSKPWRLEEAIVQSGVLREGVSPGLTAAFIDHELFPAYVEATRGWITVGTADLFDPKVQALLEKARKIQEIIQNQTGAQAGESHGAYRYAEDVNMVFNNQPLASLKAGASDVF